MTCVWHAGGRALRSPAAAGERGRRGDGRLARRTYYIIAIIIIIIFTIIIHHYYYYRHRDVCARARRLRWQTRRRTMFVLHKLH